MSAVSKIPQDQPVPAEPPAPTLAGVIIERIRAGASLEETKEYYKFLREIQADEAKVAFDQDFVQLNFPEIPRNGVIKHSGMERRYALWEDINDKIEPVLRANGFRLTFDIAEETDSSLTLDAILVHRAGHSISTRKKLPLDKSGSKNIVQVFGSTQSYAQRYAAIALLNLTSRDEDDDAVSAGNGNGPRPPDKLSEAQVAELTKAIEDSGRDVAWFCDFAAKINSINDLAPERYDAALAHVRKLPKKVTNATAD